MTTALLYVSRICLEAGGRNCSIDDVCRTIAERCKQREIHGALICIEDGLAQFMEGESEDLRAVIASQQLDWWHLSGITAFDEDIGETRFRSEEHTSELQSLMRNSYAVFCLTQK